MVQTIFPVIRILTLTCMTFLVSLLWTPSLIRLFKRLKLGKSIRDSVSSPIMAQLHAEKTGTPTMGGIVIWATVLGIAFVLFFGCRLNIDAACTWNFLSRSQTYLPLGALLAAALIGLVDDYLNSRRIGPHGGGLRMRYRLISYAIVAIVCAWWFYSKLDWDAFHVPFVGTFNLGIWYVFLFVGVLIATSHAVNLTDGLDGLAGGPLVAAFTAYGVIAFVNGRFDLATLCAVIVGALMAFLWFNVPPASFFMGDTGAMSLGTALGVIAMLTNQPLLLPLIGLPFVLETLSAMIQMTSKKFWKKKIFRSAPLHHHLEAIGWTEPQIVFRFWIVALFASGLGVILALIDRL